VALGRPATPGERAFVLPAGDAILDDAATLLAVLRSGPPGRSAAAGVPLGRQVLSSLAPYALRLEAMMSLLRAAGLVNARGAPSPEPTRVFLEASRGEALLRLARAWLTSPDFDDLRLIPTLEAEGAWRNDPLAARRSLLDFLSTLPGWLAAGGAAAERPFYSLPAFVSAVYRQFPDYQRTEGDYDSWYLRRAGTEEYLRGFETWDEVDGELIRFMIAGPMFWLGMVDLGFATEPTGDTFQPPSAFRFSAWASDLLNLRPPAGLAQEKEPVVVSANGRIHVPRLAGRAVRYQIARFAQNDKLTKDIYHYRITPASLAAAQKQGLTVAHLLSLLRRSSRGVPPALVQALERWEANGEQARIEAMTVLRLKDPHILPALLAGRAARFLGDVLSPTVVIVRPGAAEKVLEVLAELGYLGEMLS
jgi:hypothetical protein